MRRSIVVGFDGASFNVLEPLLETGALPNLRDLYESATRCVLESTIPFYTGPAWASYATGCAPAAHGIHDFMMLREDGRLSVATQRDLRRPTYYQQLAAHGNRSVLVNLPLDQQAVDGAVIVNSWLTEDDARRILPADRRSRYERLLSAYRAFPQTNAAGDARRLAAELGSIEAARFELARALFSGEDWEHFFLLFSSTDWLGHAATGLFLAGDPAARQLFVQLYRQLDGYVGWLREHAGGATFVLMSDHGQTAQTAVVRVNGVLDQLGLVAFEEHDDPDASPFFVTRRQRARMTIGMPSFLDRHRGNRLLRPTALRVKSLLRRRLGVDVSARSRRVDRARSRAFCPTDASFSVYVPDPDEATLQRVERALRDVRLVDGRPAFCDVWRAAGADGEPGPALMFAPAPGVQPSAIVRERIVDFPVGPGRGVHQRDGVLIADGPELRSAELGRASIVDVAPTLLHAMDAAVPDGVDGRVLEEAFLPGVLDARPVRREPAVRLAQADDAALSAEGEAIVTARLASLGYL